MGFCCATPENLLRFSVYRVRNANRIDLVLYESTNEPP